MNIKELKMNLMLLGFEPRIPRKLLNGLWFHSEIKNYFIRFHYYHVVIGRTKIDNRETMQPILDKIVKRIKQHESKRI